MAYDVTALKSDLIGVLHGNTLNQIYNVNGVIDRAARKLLLDCDPQETIREVAFTTPVFNSVYEYAIASDVKGISLLDIRPQVNRFVDQVFNQDYSQQFDMARMNAGNSGLLPQFNIKFNSALKTIEINNPYAPAPVIINSAEGTTINGTWTAGGNASNLTTNNVNFVASGGSLDFDLAAAGSSGYVQNTTSQSVDLSELENQSNLYLWTYLPTGSVFTSVTLQWGSSSSDYWTKSTSVTQANTAFQDGWNQLGYVWADATSVGTPDSSAVTFVKVAWAYDGTAQTGVLLNNVTCNKGQILNYLYYSKYLFRDLNTGAFQETVTDDSNLINLDTESYNLLFNLTAYFASQQQQGQNALQYDGAFFEKEYTSALEKYKLRYKSQTQKPRQKYYQLPNPNPGTGRWWWTP